MNCYHHPHNSAHGTCRVCNRGVCTDCSIDSGHSLTCNGEHAEIAASMHMLTLRNTRVLKISRKSVHLVPVFLAACGLIYLFQGFKDDDPWNFSSYCGSAFLLFSLAILVLNKRVIGGKEQASS